MNTTFELRLTQQDKEWKKNFLASASAYQHSIDQQTTVSFYSIDLMQQQLNQVECRHGRHRFIVPNAISIMGVADSRYAAEGIHQFSISTTLSAAEHCSHPEAKTEFESLLSSIYAACWERTIIPGQPRLSGYDAFLYAQLHDINYSIDAGYTLPADEWMLLENQSKWLFYANGIYLTITLMRDNKNLSDQAAYFMTLDFMTRAAFQRKYLSRWADQGSTAQEIQQETDNIQHIRTKKEQLIMQHGDFKLDTDFIYPDGQ